MDPDFNEATPTPTPTFDQLVLGNLTVNPESAGNSFRPQQATVTAFDQNDDPKSGVTIKSFANGKTASVSPSSATTGADDTALFKFKFGFLTNGGDISFIADNLNVSITQN